MRGFNYFFHIKIEIWQDIDLIDQQDITHRKNQWILEGLIMAFRHRENHRILYGSRIKFRRAHQIPNIFQYRQIQIVCSQFLQPLFRHSCIQMAHTAGVKLDRTTPVPA